MEKVKEENNRRLSPKYTREVHYNPLRPWVITRNPYLDCPKDIIPLSDPEINK